MSTCIICGTELPPRIKRRKARTICDSPVCKSEHSRRTIMDTFSKKGGEITRFRKTNGMHRPEVRAKQSAALKSMGWRPPVRGGNGHGPTKPELALACALDWDCNVIVKTHQKPPDYPHHYKLDVGSKLLRFGIEVDGMSHRSLRRKAQDKKKQELLESMGWKILRFTNDQVNCDLEACVFKVLREVENARP